MEQSLTSCTECLVEMGPQAAPIPAVPEAPTPEALESPLLRKAGFRHGFFTRRGGVSGPPWGPLNFAVSVGDTQDAVAENLRRAAQALSVDPSRLYCLSQVHGKDSIVVNDSADAREILRVPGDILGSSTPGLAIGVRIADCVPVLVGDRRTGAAVAIHSGWRGTAQNVVEVGASVLRRLGGREVDFVAAIGPHIAECCFEVGEDVALELAACSSAGESAVRRTEGYKPHVDLRRIVRAQLLTTGVQADSIDDVPGCTVCDSERFHSHRRDASSSGRMLAAIVARSLP